MSAPALEFWIAPLVFVLAVIGTIVVRRYGQRRLLDVPNERSSHDRAVPRGGGIAIVLASFAGCGALWAAGEMPSALLASIVFGGGLVAAVGFWDDHASLPASVRLLLHLAASVIAVTLLGSVQVVNAFGADWTLPFWLSWPLSVLGVTWLLNLYNFMDGIDGLAAGEAMVVAAAAFLVALLIGAPLPGLLVLAAAAAGFLCLNWPPASIFMGDVGSGYLGFVFAVYLLYAASGDAGWLWIWVILLAVFWVDATVTLLRRVMNGEPWYAAHRSHAYQRAAARLGGHRPVTLIVMAINTLALMPLAAWAAAKSGHAYVLALVATVPLIAVAVSLNAGASRRRAAGSKH